MPNTPRDEPYTILLVEDDAGDTVLFEASVHDVDPLLDIVAVNRLDAVEGALRANDVSCIVLDLGLPGASDLEALTEIERLAPDTAVVVLTGWGDGHVGVRAIAQGAQDYLVKGQADGITITRSIRFSIERKRSQVAAAALAESEVRHQEQHRLERALLVDPAIRRHDLVFSSRYIAARDGAVSGDFFDGIELPDGSIRVVIGDVSGHGPDEAALGVSLRAGWRALVSAPMDLDDFFAVFEDFLEHERVRGDEFATVCDLTFAPDLSEVCVRSAGHPAPVLVGVGALVDTTARPPLGMRLMDLGPQPGTVYPLPERWSLVAYTDGLFEIRDRNHGILGEAEVPPAVERATVDGHIDPDRLISDFAGRSIEGWRDDVAVLVVGSRP